MKNIKHVNMYIRKEKSFWWKLISLIIDCDNLFTVSHGYFCVDLNLKRGFILGFRTWLRLLNFGVAVDFYHDIL